MSYREDLGSPANLKLELSRAPGCFVRSACSWKKLHRSVCVLTRHCPAQMNARTDTHTLVPTRTCVCACLFVFLDVWHLRCVPPSSSFRVRLDVMPTWRMAFENGREEHRFAGAALLYVVVTHLVHGLPTQLPFSFFTQLSS